MCFSTSCYRLIWRRRYGGRIVVGCAFCWVDYRPVDHLVSNQTALGQLTEGDLHGAAQL